jgi:mRNA interferase RelE/StbE
MYRVIILPAALKDFKALNKRFAQRVADRLSWLAENVEKITHYPLKGPFAGLFKMRIGDWRVIYDIDYVQRVITIHRIGHRKEIYRGLK